MSSFFMGIRLPEKLEKECEVWRRLFKAPKTVPHITLIAPFQWKKAEQDLLNLLQNNLSSTTSFPIKGAELGNFSKRVIFINVTLDARLQDLQEKLANCLTQVGIEQEGRAFHPHITLASRLDAKRFEAYKKKLSNFFPNFSFNCTTISVFRLVQEQGWLEWKQIGLA